MRDLHVNMWSTVSILLPVILGLAGAVILAIEGHPLDTMLTLALVALHRYSGSLLNQLGLSVDQRADWMAVRVVTTVCCLALPFYLAATIH